MQVQLQSRSLLLGALAASTVLFTTSMASRQGHGGHGGGHGGRPGRVQVVQQTPLPRDLVRIVEGDSYVVPHGHVLVVKTLTRARGGGGLGGSPTLRIDGEAALAGGDVGIAEFALGVAARAGETVTLDTDFPDPNITHVALGYLGDD